jgi:GTP cyclohydrolase I
MLQVQKAELISSSSDHVSDSDVEVPLTGMHQVGYDKLKTVIGFGRVSRILRNFSYDEHLENLDKRLLKGFYTNAKAELVVNSDDERGIMMNRDVDHAVNHLVDFKGGDKDKLKQMMKDKFLKNKDTKEKLKPIHAIKLAGAFSLADKLAD